eukprot:1372786-Pleurochrysis_carterae.AAC.1
MVSRMRRWLSFGRTRRSSSLRQVRMPCISGTLPSSRECSAEARHIECFAQLKQRLLGKV